MNDKSLKRWATALYVADYQRLFDNAPDFKFADLSETRQATYVLRARQLKAILAKTNLAGGDDDVSCAKAAVSRVAALEAEIAALRETLGKVRSLVETLSAYPADAHRGTCGQPDADLAGGLMAVRRWRDAKRWHGCGNAWHQSQDLRRTSRIRTALLTALDGGE